MVKLKKLIAATVFCLIVFTIINFLGCVFNPIKLTGENKDRNLDAIFLGSSFVYCAVSPMEIWKDSRLRTYVLGGPEQSMDTSYYLLEQELAKTKTKYVYLDIRGLSFSDNRGFDTEDPQMIKFLDFPVVAPFAKLISAANGRKIDSNGYFYDFFTYHTQWKKLTAQSFSDALELFTEGKKRSALRGYVYLDKAGTQLYFDEGVYEEISDSYSKNFEYLKKIAALCEKNGVTLVLMTTPSCRKDYFDNYIDKVKQFCPQTEFIKMNDYTETMGFDFHSDMYDSGHANYFGAVKISSFLSNDLKKRGCTPGGSAETNKIWESDYIEYLNEINAAKS